eukprot:SAG31_NODE_17201_length_679_cov_1.086207_1_plen_133_part_00
MRRARRAVPPGAACHAMMRQAVAPHYCLCWMKHAWLWWLLSAVDTRVTAGKALQMDPDPLATRFGAAFADAFAGGQTEPDLSSSDAALPAAQAAQYNSGADEWFQVVVKATLRERAELNSKALGALLNYIYI